MRAIVPNAACQSVVRLYHKYIEGAEFKDVESLHEAAMAVPLFRQTRKELRIDEADVSLQQFRLSLCVVCGEMCFCRTPEILHGQFFWLKYPRRIPH